MLFRWTQIQWRKSHILGLSHHVHWSYKVAGRTWRNFIPEPNRISMTLASMNRQPSSHHAPIVCIKGSQAIYYRESDGKLHTLTLRANTPIHILSTALRDLLQVNYALLIGWIAMQESDFTWGGLIYFSMQGELWSPGCQMSRKSQYLFHRPSHEGGKSQWWATFAYWGTGRFSFTWFDDHCIYFASS